MHENELAVVMPDGSQIRVYPLMTRREWRSSPAHSEYAPYESYVKFAAAARRIAKEVAMLRRCTGLRPKPTSLEDLANLARDTREIMRQGGERL